LEPSRPTPDADAIPMPLHIIAATTPGPGTTTSEVGVLARLVACRVGAAAT
jgi:hypothetical protein